MAIDPIPDDLDRVRTEQGFDAYSKEVGRRHSETEARATFAHRTQAEREGAVAQDRLHLEEWRSTPEGEANYQQTCERVLRTVEDLDADGPARAAG